jgi:hypothetical protein
MDSPATPAPINIGIAAQSGNYFIRERKVLPPRVFVFYASRDF